MVPLLFVLLAFTSIRAEIGCRDEKDDIVDWYYLYKLPEQSHDFRNNGLRYAFVTSKTVGPSTAWKLSERNISNVDSIPGRTLVPILSNSTALLTLLYNDEPANGPVDFERGHTKGVVAADADSGFWLVHSVPKYPPALGEPYAYPPTGHMYGQSFLCISMTGDEMEKVGTQLLFNEPRVYSYNVPAALRSRFPTLAKVVDMVPASVKPPFSSRQTVRTRKGTEFVSFAKNRHFGKDLYAEWMSTDLDTSLLVETWQHGPGNMPSNCSVQHKSVLNVKNVTVTEQFRFATLKDHSKWAVGAGDGDSWICVGDVNRQEHQKERGGGSVCRVAKDVATMYRRMVDAIAPCPKTRSGHH